MRRTTGGAKISTTDAEGKFDTEMVLGVITVDYETREGTAKINRDFMYTSGTVVRDH